MIGQSSLAVESIADSTFQLYRAAILLSGLLLVVLALWGLGASGLARLVSGVVGAVLVGYACWLWFFLEEGRLYAVYPWLFILPGLVVGYHFYTRSVNREIDASVREQLAAERAARRADGAERADRADREGGGGAASEAPAPDELDA